MSTAENQVFNPEGFAAPAASEEAFYKQYGLGKNGRMVDDDSTVVARFYKKMVEQTFITKETGVYTEKEVDYINIVVPGNDKMEVDCPVGEQHKRRFPNAWKTYCEGREQERRGTSLDQLTGGMGTKEIVFMHSMNVFTIEDLANVTDTHIGSLGADAREKRERARKMVHSKTEATEAQKIAADQQLQLDEMKKQNGLLSEQLARALAMNEKLVDRVERLESKEKRKDS
jgi:hypothetical protein